MIPTKKTAPLPEAYSRVLLDVSRALESELGVLRDPDTAIARERLDAIARGALLCRVTARTLCVDPEATLLSVVHQFMEAI